MKKLLKTCLLGLCAFFGIVSFCNADFNLPGFTKIYEQHFTSCYGNHYLENNVNLCNGNTKTLYITGGLGIYCTTIENISLSNLNNSSTSNLLSVGLGIIANNSTANNSYLRLSASTLTEYSNGNITEPVIICGSNFISGKEASFLITFTNSLANIFSTNGLTFDMRMYYMPFNYQIPFYELDILTYVDGQDEPIITTGTINSDIVIDYDSYFINKYERSYGNTVQYTFALNDDNVISKSSVNQNYCTSNNLCPSCPSCQVCTGYSIKLYDVSDEENPSLEYSGTVENNRNIYYSGVNVDQGLLGNTKSFMFYGEDNSCSSCPSCPSCPSQYTSLECQSEYSLIPISSVNQSYCESNNLCPVCTPSTGDLIFSNVYINDILHPGRASVFVNIPDYIFWDYSVNDSEFNIYVGSGYDVDYIDSIVAINSYRPTTEDFTDVFVGGLTLIMPYVMIILFIVFVRKFIKRIFK